MLELDAEFFKLFKLCNVLGVEIEDANADVNLREEKAAGEPKHRRKRIDKKLFEEIYKHHTQAGMKLKFKNFDFERIDLRCKDLRSAVFVDCYLRNVQFSYSVIKEGLFEKCDLSGADFSHCTFFDPQFQFCNFTKASFEEANISYSRPQYPMFRSCDLSWTLWRDADGTNQIGFELVDFTGSNLFNEHKDVTVWCRECTGMPEEARLNLF